MDTIEELYSWHLITSPDIRGHLSYLRRLASTCGHVTEFGVRWGSSSAAFIASGAVFRGYDIEPTPEARRLFDIAASENRDAKYIIKNSLDAYDMEDTDLLFIDSLHTRDQAFAEMAMHQHRVRRYIAMHDTNTFGWIGEDGGPGVWVAVLDFLESQPQWRIATRFHHDNGLTILERIPT